MSNDLRAYISRQLVVEANIDEVEKRLCQKIDVSSGFTGIQGQIRKLEHIFHFYDKKNIGFLDYPNFFNALTKLNFVGMQRDIEGLFNRYDEDGTGFVDYKELACSVYGLSMHPNLDAASRSLLYELRLAIIEKHGAAGLFVFKEELQDHYQKESSLSLLNISDLENMLSEYIDASSKAFKKFLAVFDPEGHGMVS
jgi:hypothetical protein